MQVLELFIFLFFSSFTVLLFRRHNLIKEHKFILNKKLKKTNFKKVSNFNKKFKETLFYSGALGAASLFSYFYQLSKINPQFLQAIKQVHGNSQDLTSNLDIIKYAKMNIIHDGLQQYDINKYKGYLGEQKHFDYLADSGHEVIVPDSPNQEGYDAIIDGEKINVKVSNSENYIQDHLDKNPDIPIHTGTNIEHMENVEGFEHLSNSVLESETVAGFDGIDSFAEIPIPVVIPILSAYRNLKHLKNEDKDISTFLEHTVTETASTTAGMAVGHGLIPIVGGIIGGIIGRSLGNLFKKRHLRKALKEMEHLCSDIMKEFKIKSKSISDKAKKINKKRNTNLKGQFDQSFLARFFNPTLKTIFIKMAVDKNNQERDQFDFNIQDIKREIEFSKSREEIIHLGCVLSQSQELFFGDTNLINLSEKISNQIKVVEEEKKKAS